MLVSGRVSKIDKIRKDDLQNVHVMIVTDYLSATVWTGFPSQRISLWEIRWIFHFSCHFALTVMQMSHFSPT